MLKKNKLLLSFLVTLVLGLLYFYLSYPVLNIQSFEFWAFIIFLLATFCISLLIFTSEKSNIKIIKGSGIYFNSYHYPKVGIWACCSIFVILGIILVLNFILSPVFFSKEYAKRIFVDETKNFVEDVAPVDFNALPILDKDSSQKLGDRVMGQMPELVSQFNVSELYTQINYKNQIIRVTPLEYDGIIKYFTNHKEGVKGYITVNSVNGEAKLTKLEQGMKFMPSALFNEKLTRHLRFQFLTDIFGESQFELDENGNPYWVTPVIKYTGVNLKKEIIGIIITDPITGNSTKYEVKDVPTWVDHVYESDLIIEQLNQWGEYKNGFLNSIFGQKNVVTTTEGYNYTVMNDDVYLYTGITSATSDESSLGFTLTNMRTKETKFYATPGAKEISAMDSAKGQVQQMKYTATFPLLINLNNRPTYFISLKDDAGLVKMYAFVDVGDYQKVVVTDAAKGIEKAMENYLNNVSLEPENGKSESKEITIKQITNAMIDGTTYYYIIDNNNKKYRAKIHVEQELLPFLKSGDKIKIEYNLEKSVIEITKIENR